MRNLHNLGLFASMGGPFDRVFFELYVMGDSVVPKEITRIIGVNPTEAYEKGDEMHKSKA